ncbi:MAG: adenylate kinase family protein [Candidatus Geothermarchaeales archaeon]
MLVALTGTPGTGKSTVAPLLEKRGFRLCDVNGLARRCGALRTYDHKRESWEVDLGVLERSIPKRRPLILVGHLSHLLPVDLSIVLRCHPEILRKRLQAKGWGSSKVRENVEAEALGVIAQEAMEGERAFEVDTTSASTGETARIVLDILAGRGERYKAGSVDWSEVILGWF